MSPDARKSIYLWVVAVAVFGALFALPYLDIPERRPAWMRDLISLACLVGFGRYIYGFWQRRASNPKNPNNEP